MNIKFKHGNIIDGSATQEDWFPQINCDIFLSHSHLDIDRAKKLAGWFKNKFNLDVFIDHNVWGYINELLKLIDDDFCYDKNKKTYSYEKRNVTTSHVHMMLINALSEIMDKTECLLFFETPNSINLKKLTHTGTTSSPWIYNEIFLSKILRKKQRRKNSNIEKAAREIKLSNNLNESFKIDYDTDISHLVKLTFDDIKSWLDFFTDRTDIHPLDILYSIKQIK
ncbi:hypothetical protein [Winogradskyella sp. SYSU M77433]|uniref:hypothetical protein n=1 Tax=Winogradskyella sp. SYSU M77433 TaxID=3042722 RepID=UPI00247FEB05|nr:hypothetical protein [Winogradskyella sp. SYSU M77433]MDH7912078.1 hypothetical protein [Winogradskyella sp. SYSU M77433]